VVASGLSKEPEDHMAFICEVMAGLIMGSSNNSRPLQQQKLFFTRHLAPWAHRFFVDLESAKASELYKPIGSLGRVFMRIEADAFEMIGD
jgi:TorA maturation chaperone TorD